MDTQPSECMEIIEGLNVFRALEAWGAALYAAWAANEPDARLAAGHLIIAEREALHARVLAERIRALGAEPSPACVDAILERQLGELREVTGFVAQLDALKRVNERDATSMADCQRALERGRQAAEASDPSTYSLLEQLYGEEKVSAAWYRRTYGELTGRHPLSNALPILSPAQIVRRAQRAAATAPASDAAAASAS